MPTRQAFSLSRTTGTPRSPLCNDCRNRQVTCQRGRIKRESPKGDPTRQVLSRRRRGSLIHDMGTSAGRLLLRVTVGSIFVEHGTQKLFGWFGGHGPSGTGQFFESLGLRPGRRNAIAAGIAEAGGGALLVLGLATPAAASAGGTGVGTA